MAAPQELHWEREITIVLAGKSGAGKSTFTDNILGSNQATSKTAPPSIIDKVTHSNGVKMRIINALGIAEYKKDKLKELKALSTYTNGKADLLVYCLPVGPGNKFDYTNPEIIQSLTDAYGKEIWEHCIVVFTMSNMALSMFQDSNPATATQRYKEYLKEYADAFQSQLYQLKVETCIKTIFHMGMEPPTSNTIFAIPVGRKLDDPILPDLPRTIPALDGVDMDNPGWRDVVLAMITTKCPRDYMQSILEYKNKNELGRRILVGVEFGSGGGAIVGAVLGIVAGPPIGMVAGAVVGAIVGGAIAGVIVYVM